MGSSSPLSILEGERTFFDNRLLHQMFEERVCEKTAIIFRDEDENERRTSYISLNSTANQIASTLLDIINSKKLQPNNDGDWVVAVCMKPSDNLICSLLAIWKAGAAYLPLDVYFPANRISHIMNESKPALTICDDDFERLEVFGEACTVLKFDELKASSLKFSTANIAEQQKLPGNSGTAVIFYTSGSTGIPKGVRLPHRYIQNHVEWEWKKFPHSEKEHFGILKTVLTFLDSVSETWGTLLSGLTLVIVPSEVAKNPSKLIDILEEFNIERMYLVPTLLRSLLLFLSMQKSSKKLNNLKNWFCGGEALSFQLAKEFFDYFEEGSHTLWNYYGATEGEATFYPCESKKQLDSIGRVPIGIPYDNTIIYVLDSDLKPVNAGEIGELYVSGASVALGYVKGREPYRFIDNPLAFDPIYSKMYKTGDLASMKEEMIYYEGRSDSQIKIRGHRVDLTEIEKNLDALDYVEKDVVLCYHAGEIDQALVAFCVVKDCVKRTGLEIEDDLKLTLVSYMVPQIVVLDSIPLLVSGKVDRQSLLKMYESNIDQEIDYEGIDIKSIEKAKAVFETVRNVIGRSIRSKLTKSANFYELGGNSLNSIFTIAELRKKGFFISVDDFIKAANLGEVIENITLSDDINGDEEENIFNLQLQREMKLTASSLTSSHKQDFKEIITTSFCEKGDLEQLVKDKCSFEDYNSYVEEVWDYMLAKDLSFIVKDGNGRSVGASMNFDLYDEPEFKVDSNVNIFFELEEFLFNKFRDLLPKEKNQVLHAVLMGTNANLNAKENIAVMMFMENEMLELARRKIFSSIIALNTSPLTQQLDSNIFDYKKLLEYQVNQFVYHDGSRPFEKAPDTMMATVHWKDVREE